MSRISKTSSELIFNYSLDADGKLSSGLILKLFLSSRANVVLNNSQVLELISTILDSQTRENDHFKIITTIELIESLSKKYDIDLWIHKHSLILSEAYYSVGQFDSSFLFACKFMDYLLNQSLIQNETIQTKMGIISSLEKLTILYCSIFSISMRNGSYLQKFGLSHVDFYFFLESIISNLAYLILDYPQILKSFSELRLFYSAFVEVLSLNNLTPTLRNFVIPIEIKKPEFVELLKLEFDRLKSEILLFDNTFSSHHNCSDLISKDDIEDSVHRLSSFDSPKNYNKSCLKLLDSTLKILSPTNGTFNISNLLVNPKSPQVLISDYFYPRYYDLEHIFKHSFFHDLFDLDVNCSQFGFFGSEIKEYSNLASIYKVFKYSGENDNRSTHKESRNHLISMISKNFLHDPKSIYSFCRNLFVLFDDSGREKSIVFQILPPKSKTISSLALLDHVIENHFNSHLPEVCGHLRSEMPKSDTFESTLSNIINSICYHGGFIESFNPNHKPKDNLDSTFEALSKSLSVGDDIYIKQKIKYTLCSFHYASGSLPNSEMFDLMIDLVSNYRGSEIDRVMPTRLFSIATSDGFCIDSRLEQWVDWLCPMVYQLVCGLASHSYITQKNCYLILSFFIENGKIDFVINYILGKRSENPCYDYKDIGSNGSPSETHVEFVRLLIEKMRHANPELVSASYSFINESMKLMRLISDEFMTLFSKAKEELSRYFKFKTGPKGILEIMKPLTDKVSSSQYSSGYEISFISKFKPLIENLVTFTILKIDEFDSFEMFWNERNSFSYIQYMILNFNNPSKKSSFLSMRSLNNKLDSVCTVPIPVLLKPLSTTMNLVSISNNLAYIKSISHRFKFLEQTKTRPKLITMFLDVNDESRQTDFILKGGEDVNGDLRINQMWETINETIPDLKLKTYGVIPIAYCGGYIQVISNVHSLFSIYKPYLKSPEFCSKIGKNLVGDFSNPLKLFDLIKTSVGNDRLEVYNKLSDLVPDNLINSFLLTNSNSSYDYILRHQNFVRSLAGISISGYLVGLGDRHLDNIMVSSITGALVNVDLNMSFERGMLLKNIETVPYRMTRSLQYFVGRPSIKNNFLAIRGGGIYLKSSSKLLLGCRSIKEQLINGIMISFEFDPTLEWIQLSNKDPRFEFDFTGVKDSEKNQVDLISSDPENQGSDYLQENLEPRSQESFKLFSQDEYMNSNEFQIFKDQISQLGSSHPDNPPDIIDKNTGLGFAISEKIEYFEICKNQMVKSNYQNIHKTGLSNISGKSFIPLVPKRNSSADELNTPEPKQQSLGHTKISSSTRLNDVESYLTPSIDYFIPATDAFGSFSDPKYSDLLSLSARLIAINARNNLTAKLCTHIDFNSDDFFDIKGEISDSQSYNIGKYLSQKKNNFTNSEKQTLLLWDASSKNVNLINMYEGWSFWF
ncbi:Serine/threonine-protein kinase smg-1 [Smittium mucronatum]|uniref:Serine/threonine-protein kinase smg-1 n=1 Tax=Smittium mucronatum TaxID=133383 RepID=A0A1R0GXI2_9FUNG|nr:Serine/threonine-protein kinase smg-1 [Smittium mucronatum]